MKKTKKLQKIIASTVFQRNTPADALLSVGSQQVASFTELSFPNPAKLTGVSTPTRDTDAVPLQYLQTHYLSKNDPNPGYLPIKGGSMTGNINMGTHSIFNLKQPEAPKIPLPQDTKPTDPREDAGFENKTAVEQEREIAEYNTKLAAYQKKIDDYNAAWQAFYSEAATVKYVKKIVEEITGNTQLDTAIQSATEVEKKIDLAHKTLGIEITQNPDAPDPTTVSNTGGNTTPTPTGPTTTPAGPTDPDAPSYENLPSIIKSSLFVLTQSDNTLKGDLKMTNAQISNIKTPAESGEENHAANVEYLNKQLQPPKRAFVSHTLPTPANSNSISISGHIPWLSTASGSTTTEPDFKSSLADQCLQAEQDHLKIKTPGLLVLSVRGTWNGTTSGGGSGGATQTPETFPVTLTVTPDSNGSSSTGSSPTTPTPTTLTLPLTLHSGESVMLQLPITAPSSVKIAPNPQSSGGGGSGSTTAPTTLSSWSWEAALFPTDVTTATTPPTPTPTPTPPSPAPAPAPTP